MSHIIGIDEVGRGPLAGPVVAAAVCFTLKLPKLSLFKFNLKRLSYTGLKDSKKLSAKQREQYYNLFVKTQGIEWGIGKVSEKTIDKINIYQATRLAMKKAVMNLQTKLKKSQSPLFYDRRKMVTTSFALIIDGNMFLDLPLPQKAIIKADETVLQCSIASIIAKVTRDKLMIRYHKQYPQYGFDKHKGYGTALHMQAIQHHGPCAIHRKTFAPIRA
jgi:ribonuclease HII